MPEQYLHGVEVVQLDTGTRPIQTANSSTIGLVGTASAAPEGIPRNMPILITGPKDAREKLGTNGTLPDAYEAQAQQGAGVAIAVIAPDGANAAETKAKVAGNTTEQTGAFALSRSRAVLDMVPRITAAPGFTGGVAGGAVNPVVSSLLTVANKNRAIVIKDGPNTNETDAKADALSYGSDRLYMVDPAVTALSADGQDVTRPASGYVAGLIARNDIERGFWYSPSNRIIRGITGTARPVEFNLSAKETEANRLNEAKIATIVRQNGLRLWGSRGLAADPLWAFISVRRTADIVFESIERSLLWAMARPFSTQLVCDIRNTVQQFGNGMVAQGALLGFKCWFDPELNTEVNMKAGKLYLDFDFEPPAPLEHLIIRGRRNGLYYDDLIQNIKAA